MIHKPYKTFRSLLWSGSFLILLLQTTVGLSAAEVTRSLSLENRVRLLEQQLSAANRLRAESQFEITNLKNEIRDLRGTVEEQGYQLQQIVSRQRELYKDIDQRLNLANSETKSEANSSTPVTPNLSTSSAYNTENPESQTTDFSNATGFSNASTLANPTTLSDDEIRGVYDKIFPLVRSKRYDDAIAGYQQFISNFPESIYVANSRYWLAQIYSVLGRTDEAEKEYLEVANNYSSSAKASDSWLKLGKLYEQKNNNERAIEAYNKVITQYSNSTAAKIAVSRLQDLKSSNN